MRLLLAASAAAALLVACSSPGGNDGGGGGSGGGDPQEVIIKASGTATVHPLGSAFLADAGLTNPGVNGLQLRIEEPFKVAVGDPLGIFGTKVLDATGTFSIDGISSELVNLGVAAGIRDDAADGGSSARIVRSATVLFDVALEGEKPRADITNGKAFAIPTPFHDQLNAAITPTAIRAITGANGQGTLQAAGWVLGRVVDANGTAVSGVTVTASPASYNAQFFYPNADFSGTGTSTSSNGTFVFVHAGGAVATFRVNVTGRSEYKQRNLGAAKDAVLVLTYYPGTTAPP